MSEKRFGKITRVEIGRGGYQECMFGIKFTFEGKHWAVNDFRGFWSYTFIKTPDKKTKWTEEERTKQVVEMIKFIEFLLEKAKKDHVSQLKGLPVEVEFDINTLVSWRILEEVL